MHKFEMLSLTVLKKERKFKEIFGWLNYFYFRRSFKKLTAGLKDQVQ